MKCDCSVINPEVGEGERGCTRQTAHPTFFCVKMHGNDNDLIFYYISKFQIKSYVGAIFDMSEEFDDSRVYNSTLGHKVLL